MTTPLVVTNNTPVSHLLWIGQLPLLGLLFGRVFIPAQVDELDRGQHVLGAWREAPGALRLIHGDTDIRRGEMRPSVGIRIVGRGGSRPTCWNAQMVKMPDVRTWHSRTRMLMFLPHPNYHGPRKFNAAYSAEQMNAARNQIASHSPHLFV